MLAPRYLKFSDIDLRRCGVVPEESRPKDPSRKVNFFAADRAGRAVAVLVVGPYGMPSAYAECTTDWCLRAQGLVRLHGLVALVLPKDARPEPYTGYLAEVQEVRVAVFQDPLTPGEPAPPPGPRRANRD
jgi:hypothetical protein